MHWFNIATLFVALTLVGVEFSVSAFVYPAAWRLASAAQVKMLGRFALVLGRVMPFWYVGVLLLLGMETWLSRHTSGFRILLAAISLWLLTTLATIVWLVPLNNGVAKEDPAWQRMSRTWDRRHRVRIAALATAVLLLTCVVAR